MNQGWVVLPVFSQSHTGLHHEKVRHLVALLEWLEIVPWESRRAGNRRYRKAIRAKKRGKPA